MNTPNKQITDIIDTLTKSNVNFTLYRLPWTDACYMVLQKDGDVEELLFLNELDGKKGFVMAPFMTDDNKKILLIRPDIFAFDWDEITSSLEELYNCKDIINTHISSIELGNNNSYDSTDIDNIPVRDDDQRQDYTECFNKFHNAIEEKKFTKLVLSRYVTEEISDNFSPTKAFVDACNSYPRMFIYLCHTTKAGTWLGSTPEIILSGHTDGWHTVALAGTMTVQDNVIPTEWSKKNIDEQKYVADYIRQTIKKMDIAGKIEEKGPYAARAGHLVHRKTDFFFNLKDNRCMGSVLNKLHPTPAICGVPREEASEFILLNENYDRSYYSGIIGLLDVEKGTDLYVNLRCMQLGNENARLYAGGGILSSSVMEEEWEETERKLATMRKILTDNYNNI